MGKLVEKSKRYKIGKVSDIGSLLYRKNKDNRPYLDVKIFDIEFQVLLDTCSNISLLGSIGIEQLYGKHLNIKLDESLRVTTANGQLQEVLGFI